MDVAEPSQRKRRRCRIVVEEISEPGEPSERGAGVACRCVAVPVPTSDEAAVQSVLLRRGEFAELQDTDAARQAEFRKALACCASLSFRQALDVRGWALKEKVMKTNWRMLKLAPRIVKQWLDGVGVLELSKQFDLPPVAILRHAVEKRLGSKQAMRQAIRQAVGSAAAGQLTERETQELTERETQELQLAQRLDMVNRLDCSSQSEAADAFEVEIQTLLTSMAMGFTTQEQLIAQQTASMGRPVSTPDFLLQDGQQTLVVNGCAVRWLEAKNFYGSGCKMMARQVQKQTDRYIAMFGPGAVVFASGFASSLQEFVSPGVQLIGFDEMQQAVQAHTSSSARGTGSSATADSTSPGSGERAAAVVATDAGCAAAGAGRPNRKRAASTGDGRGAAKKHPRPRLG